MARQLLLGLFHEASPTAETIDQLRKAGVPDEKITVMSGMPYRGEMLGRPRPKRGVTKFALTGALLGLITGLFLSIGIFLLYPIDQGGQPIVPLPPTLIILFEVTMLGTMWASFLGMLWVNRFPITKPQLYDPRITEGHIGVAVEVDEALADAAEKVLTDNGAHHLRRVEATPPAGRFLFPRYAPASVPRVSQYDRPDLRHRAFWAVLIGGVVVATLVIGVFAYGVTGISFPTNMADQYSIASQQGPRLAAPAQAIPVQGPDTIDNQPATEPLASTPDSIARGKTLFGINCALCHGLDAKGDGKLSGFFNPKPKDLTSAAVQGLSDQEIYMVITNGIGPMPSLAENLGGTERWDVINYVRTLKK